MTAKKTDEPEDRAEDRTEVIESAAPGEGDTAAESGTTTPEGAESESATTPAPAAESESTTVAAPAAEAESATGTVAASANESAAEKVSLLSRLRPKGGRGTKVALRAAVAVVLGAAVGSSIYFYTQNKDHQDVLDAQAEARQAACAYGPVVSTYDSKHLDQYVRDVLAGATGDWRKQFESNSKDLGDVLVKGEVVAKSTDVQCAIRSADKNSAEAIVVIGQTITSLGTQGKPEPGQLSTVMRLEKHDGHWLVGKISTPLAPLPPQS
ncbi:hypothetical protein [Nocardia nova]|uniref:hypothetical protein n=1 Tax=Nocardia nova TaxID=37330 RepID=UPI003403D54C